MDAETEVAGAPRLRPVEDSTADLLRRIGDVEDRLKSVEQLLKDRARRPERLRGAKFDPAFQGVADAVLGRGRTLLSQDRLYVLWQSVRNVSHLMLPAAEVGVYRGGSAYFIANAYLGLLGHEVRMHVFDTFEGHPAAKVSEHDLYHKAGMFSDVSFEDVKAYLSAFHMITIHRGEFSETVQTLSERSFGLVHVDVDLYETTLQCLQYFGDRVAPGGVMIVDDFGAKKCPGVAKATAAFLDHPHHFQVWHVPTQQLLLVRK